MVLQIHHRHTLKLFIKRFNHKGWKLFTRRWRTEKKRQWRDLKNCIFNLDFEQLTIGKLWISSGRLNIIWLKGTGVKTSITITDWASGHSQKLFAYRPLTWSGLKSCWTSSWGHYHFNVLFNRISMTLNRIQDSKGSQCSSQCLLHITVYCMVNRIMSKVSSAVFQFI